MKTTIASIIVSILIIGGALLYANKSSSTTTNTPVDNVSVVDGKQIIEINVKGGYQPRKNVAKAGLPTTIRFNTSGTYDCSIAVRIPSLNIAKNVPPVGSTDIDVGTPKPGILRGMCAMGMYSFEVEFK
jgi:plastocyanin domain-containing protein